MKKNKQPLNNQITIYQSPDGGVNIEVLYANENIWLTQKRMAELFEVTVPTINEHLANIFKSGELDKDSVIREFRTTAADGKSYATKFYGLEAIRASSKKGNDDERLDGKTECFFEV